MALSLIAGLGNPGRDYESTRHNVGFWLIDRLARSAAQSLTAQPKLSATACKASTGPAAGCWLLEPQTFMNHSGRAVSAAARFYQIPPEQILVVHDELDLPPGAIRLKQGGGHGGHNGVRDISSALGSPSFWRLRIGIGHPRTLGLSQDVADFVLHRPKAEELIAIEAALDRCCESLPDLIQGRFDIAQRRLHGPTSP
ncbi:Pth Peptidyl-tRNA hydrolase [Burkholderiales bacterium]|jgi:PTH1 family peptidyl-tRNA hydrolase